MIKDIHTHRLFGKAEESILSYFMKDGSPAAEAVYLSPGIHPWFLTDRGDLIRQTAWLDRQMVDPRVIALGEAGLDKLCACPWNLQVDAFKAVADLAERARMPLVIHCVKATAELMALKKDFRPSVPWIVHGFRGKKELADSLTRQGFYLSFGGRYQVEALRAVPAERLLFETDGSTVPVERLFEQAAADRNCTTDELWAQVGQTTNRLFFSR